MKEKKHAIDCEQVAEIVTVILVWGLLLPIMTLLVLPVATVVVLPVAGIIAVTKVITKSMVSAWIAVSTWIEAKVIVSAWIAMSTRTMAIFKRKNANSQKSTNPEYQSPSRLVRYLPPDSQAYLYELRKRWRKCEYSQWRIELKTYWWALGMLKGYLESKLDNLFFPYKKS